MRSEAERFEQLYDVERHVMATDGSVLVEDPYPDAQSVRIIGFEHRGPMVVPVVFG